MFRSSVILSKAKDIIQRQTSPKPMKGLLAHFGEPNYLLDAVKSLRGLGLKKMEVYSPYPIHGIDDALGVERSKVPWISLIAGLCGFGAALLMQGWMNAIDYKLNIGGKPFFSGPAFVPIMFELTVLFSGLATFIGLFAVCGLPKYSSVFEKDHRAHKSTDDEFMLFVDAEDPHFNENTLKQKLEKLKGIEIRWIGK